VLFGPFREASAGHPLAQAALFDECFLQLPKLPVEQIVGQLDQPDHYIGCNGRIAMLNAFLEGFIVGVRLAVELPESLSERVFLFLFLEPADAQEVAVVF
jgi:hypothetical protein